MHLDLHGIGIMQSNFTPFCGKSERGFDASSLYYQKVLVVPLFFFKIKLIKLPYRTELFGVRCSQLSICYIGYCFDCYCEQMEGRQLLWIPYLESTFLQALSGPYACCCNEWDAQLMLVGGLYWFHRPDPIPAFRHLSDLVSSYSCHWKKCWCVCLLSLRPKSQKVARRRKWANTHLCVNIFFMVNCT